MYAEQSLKIGGSLPKIGNALFTHFGTPLMIKALATPHVSMTDMDTWREVYKFIYLPTMASQGLGVQYLPHI